MVPHQIGETCQVGCRKDQVGILPPFDSFVNDLREEVEGMRFLNKLYCF